VPRLPGSRRDRRINKNGLMNDREVLERVALNLYAVCAELLGTGFQP
jgi:hypothetical protein